MLNPFIAIPGGWELVLVVLVILLLFGAKKLPELARGSGRALRIFKAETKGLVDDDDDDDDLKTPEQREIEARQVQPPRPRRRVSRWCASSATAPPADRYPILVGVPLRSHPALCREAPPSRRRGRPYGPVRPPA